MIRTTERTNASAGYYFAYGSNLLVERIRLPERAPGARPVGLARLEGWRLSFDKRGTDGSGKATVHRAEKRRQVVHGMLYELNEVERRALDADEGPDYYTRRLEVTTADGPCRAWFYIAVEACRVPGLAPFGWYRSLVVAGARQQGLPAAYVAALEAVAVRRDPDPERAARMHGVLARAGYPA